MSKQELLGDFIERRVPMASCPVVDAVLAASVIDDTIFRVPLPRFITFSQQEFTAFVHFAKYIKYLFLASRLIAVISYSNLWRENI